MSGILIVLACVLLLFGSMSNITADYVVKQLHTYIPFLFDAGNTFNIIALILFGIALGILITGLGSKESA